MKVFLTGSSGFVGVAVCEALLERGDSVTGLDLAPPPPAALEAFAALPGTFHAIEGDVRDTGGMVKALRASGADCVIALAALTAGPERERATPRDIFEVNVCGSVGAIEAARECEATRIVHISSGSVYGASGRAPAALDEDTTPLRPEGLYGMSKQAAEAAALRLGDLSGLDVRVGRLGTCFGRWERETGARDTPSAPFQILRCATRGERVALPRAHPRDWLYDRDAAAAILALLDAPPPPRRIYNLAAGHIWSLVDFCSALAEVRPDFRWGLATSGEPANIALYADYDRAPMAIDRLLADTRFSPRFDLDAAMADYLPWFAAQGPSRADRRLS